MRWFQGLSDQYQMYRELVRDEEGVTVPEYMLVLGFVSIAVVVAFQVGPVSTAISALADNISLKITPDA